MKRSRIQLSHPSLDLCPVCEYFTLTRVDRLIIPWRVWCCLAPTAFERGWGGWGSLSCNTCYYTGSRCTRFHENNRPVKSPPTTRHSYKSLIFFLNLDPKGSSHIYDNIVWKIERNGCFLFSRRGPCIR